MKTTLFIYGTGKLIKFDTFILADEYIKKEHLNIVNDYIAYNNERYIDVER